MLIPTITLAPIAANAKPIMALHAVVSRLDVLSLWVEMVAPVTTIA